MKTAKILGQIHLDRLRFESRKGSSITKTDLQRILAYNEIKDLNGGDIKPSNVGLLFSALEWTMWIPKIDYKGNKYGKYSSEREFNFCGICGEKILVYNATYPDGTMKNSISEHRAECRKKDVAIMEMKFYPDRSFLKSDWY